MCEKITKSEIVTKIVELKPLSVQIIQNHKNKSEACMYVSGRMFTCGFEIDYDLDAGKNILVKIPKYISNIHTYSMVVKDKSFNENQAKLLKYKEMVESDKYYETNYYFKKDSLIFKLL